ncbi:putative RNA methyltransferase [Trichinella spiralis]|uniref:RNA methyltransferase n=1 Tax=Trichinella spiralis TaxID=6334 RepID=A0ABR3L3W5_TRISP
MKGTLSWNTSELCEFELLYLSSYAWFENTVHTELKNIQIYTTKPSVCLLAAAASCDKACAVISSTTMSNPNNERILCVDHNGNIIYLSREDLQRAYDTILETAVTEYSRRMGMHTGNVRESRSESTEMSGPLLQQQQHHQQHEEVEFSFSPWRCTCAPNVQFGAVPIRESSLQYQQLQLPEVYETNRGNSELLPQSTSDDDEWQSHEYVLPAIERLPYGNVEFGLISSSSTWDHNVRSVMVPIDPETHFVTISPSCPEDMHPAEELVARSEGLSSPVADVQFRVTKVDKACQTDDWLDLSIMSSEKSSSSTSSEIIYFSRSPRVNERPETLSASEPCQKQNKIHLSRLMYDLRF